MIEFRETAANIIDKAAAKVDIGTPLGKIEWVNALSEEITAALVLAESQTARQIQQQIIMVLGELSGADQTSTWNLAINEAVRTVNSLPLTGRTLEYCKSKFPQGQSFPGFQAQPTLYRREPPG